MIKDITKFEIEWLMEYSEGKNAAIFYCESYEHSPICIVKGNDRKVLIACNGEMSIPYQLNNEEFIIKDFWDLMEAGINSDNDVIKLLEDGSIDYDWDYNPWLEAYDITELYEDDDINMTKYFEAQSTEDIPSLEITKYELKSIISEVNNYITAYR